MQINMSKRPDNIGNAYSVPAKRPKYNTNKDIICAVKATENSAKIKSSKCDDLWGDDFAEEDIEEMDFVASQACLQEDNVFSQSSVKRDTSFVEKFNNVPSTSNAGSSSSGKKIGMKNYSLNSQQFDSQKINGTSGKLSQINYLEFENRLMKKGMHNSTFKSENNVVVSEAARLKELEKLKVENTKLLNDFITKDGEVVFLRNQLQQTQLRAENDNLEKTRFIEEQSSRHRTEIDAIKKENQHLKTQLELQMFEVGNLLERCKLLGSGNIKLAEPHTVNPNHSVNKSKCSPMTNRLSSSVKPVKLREAYVQTNVQSRSSHFLKTWCPYHPLAEIPELLYDKSQPERSVVDIQITEKTGRRNLPILKEDDTFRIFENPELAKPVTTMVDGKRLTTEFISPEVSVIQRMTDAELESENCISIINKLVATARELMLNAIIGLQTIVQAMRNDDIRDMNDVYFSDLYSNPSFTAKCVCDANVWHECERGVEARRIFGTLSYVVPASSYLSGYVAGKTRLRTERDESYKHYSQQMVRYQAWPDRGREFEMLEMILQFVDLVGSTRRAHQFSGLICAITMVLYNVHNGIGYCSKGMGYVFQIFRQIVFSRPLPYCYVLLSNMMTVFIKSTTYLRKLCVNSKSMAVNNWKGVLHFTPDACPLQIFLAQMENYPSDLLVTIDITHTLLLFVRHILHTNVIPLRSESSESCNCCMKLLRFTIKALCKCSEVNLSSMRDSKRIDSLLTSDGSCSFKQICAKHSTSPAGTHESCIRQIHSATYFTDVNSWVATQRKQLNVLADGMRFLCHLAICDPDFVIRLSDIEDAFHLFIRNMNTFDNLVLHENELEAMNRMKQTFIFDKTPQSEATDEVGIASNQLNILSNFEKRFVRSSSENTKQKENHSKSLSAIKMLYKTKC